MRADEKVKAEETRGGCRELWTLSSAEGAVSSVCVCVCVCLCVCQCMQYMWLWKSILQLNVCPGKAASVCVVCNTFLGGL